MTLPLRKKLLTTVQSTRSLAKEHNSARLRARAVLKRSLWVGLLLATNVTSLQAQTSGWQPNRLPNSSSMQPITSSPLHRRARLFSRPTESITPVPTKATRASSCVGAQVNASTAARSPITDSSRVKLRAKLRVKRRARCCASPSDRAGSFTDSQLYCVEPSSSATATASTNPLRSSGATSSPRPAASATTTATFVPRGSTTGVRSSVQPANFQTPLPGAPGGNSQLDNFAPPASRAKRSLEHSAPTYARPPSNFPPAAQPQDALNAPEAAPAPPVAPPAQDNFPQTPELSLPQPRIPISGTHAEYR